MQGGLFFSKKSWKYCDGISKYFIKFSHAGCRKDYFYQKNPRNIVMGVLKYFTVFAQEKLQKNQAYFVSILVQIIGK
jgi:hypothetical protein